MYPFSTTDYLGVRFHPEFRALVTEGMERYGAHYGGSRASNACPSLYGEAEEVLAELCDAPAVLVVSSGSLAGALVIDHVTSAGYVPRARPGTHPALTLVDVEPGVPRDRTAILADTVDVTRCLETDLEELRGARPETTLVLDDSHGIGLRGRRGGGVYRDAREHHDGRLLVVASLGKAFGIPAGAIIGDADAIAAIRATPRFAGASPPAPPQLHAFVHGQELYASCRAALSANIERFRAAVPADTFESIGGHPVFRIRDDDLARHLLAAGFEISSFSYPSPTDPVVSRIVLSAAHTSGDVDALARAIARWSES